MPSNLDIKVDGLAQMQRQLKKLGDTETPKAIKAAGKSAAQVVIDRARTRLPKVSGRLAASLKASSTAKAVSVKGGSNAVPYAGSVEFGGYPKERPFVKEGRYIFPAAQDSEAEIVSKYEEELDRVIDQFNS